MKLAGWNVPLTALRRKVTLLCVATLLVLVLVCLQYQATVREAAVGVMGGGNDALGPVDGFADAQRLDVPRTDIDHGVQFVVNAPRPSSPLIQDQRFEQLTGSAPDSRLGALRSPPYVPTQRLMHLDLKGAPPLLMYIKEVLPLARKLGATGLLLEWEDMFPWRGPLAPLAAKNAYSRAQVKEILMMAHDANLEVIPLVQTFGHLEFALKNAEFSSLREVPDSPQALCPSLNSSLDLVHQLIDQIMEVHIGVQSLHIGCDEVFQMGECSRCRIQSREFLFLNHVSRVAKYIQSRYSNVQPIIWDDMLRSLSIVSLEHYNIGELVEPMIWVYAEDVYRFVPSTVWDKYATVFGTVWAASAFKGAFGETLYVPNAKRHLNNNLRWLQVMANEAPKFTNGFRGIAITGWQRYDHFAVLCELLPSAIPSLAVNLLATSHGYMNSSLRHKLNTALNCGVFAPSSDNADALFLNLDSDPYLWEHFSRCPFPGFVFFKLTYRLSMAEKEVEDFIASVRKAKGWLTDYNVRHNFSVPMRIDEIMGDHPRLYHTMTTLVHSAKEAMEYVFDAYTISEWVEQRIYPLITQLEAIQRDTITLKSHRIWPRRPFPKLRDLDRFGIFASDYSSNQVAPSA